MGTAAPSCTHFPPALGSVCHPVQEVALAVKDSPALPTLREALAPLFGHCARADLALSSCHSLPPPARPGGHRLGWRGRWDWGGTGDGGGVGSIAAADQVSGQPSGPSSLSGRTPVVPVWSLAAPGGGSLGGWIHSPCSSPCLIPLARACDSLLLPDPRECRGEGERGGLRVRDPFHDPSCPHSGTSARAPLLHPKHPLLLVQPLALPWTGPACSDVQQQQNVKTEAGNIPRMFPRHRPWCCGTSPGLWWHRALGMGHLHEATHVSHTLCRGHLM